MAPKSLLTTVKPLFNRLFTALYFLLHFYSIVEHVERMVRELDASAPTPGPVLRAHFARFFFLVR